MNAIEAYSKSISPKIPPNIMKKAERFVANHKPEGLLEGYEVFNLAQVLIVDDDPNLAVGIRIMAELAGHTVTTVFSPDQAIALIEQNSFNLAVIDGLRGHWREVVEASVKKGIRPVVVSGDGDILNEAQSKGIDVIQKAGNKQYLDQITNLFSES